MKAGKITLDTAKQNLHNFIEKDHPRRFVNTVNIAKDQVIDLSDGGIHHSWEMDSAVPNGNIVYEVQVDVQDEFCTLRSFDQGNMKGDGSVRPLTIEDYFKALNTDPEANIPENYQRELQHSQVGSASINELFSTPNYQTICYEFSGELPKEITTTSDSFHHIFVLEGEVEVKTEEKNYKVKKGWSLLVPAAASHYAVFSDKPSKVFFTTS